MECRGICTYWFMGAFPIGVDSWWGSRWRRRWSGEVNDVGSESVDFRGGGVVVVVICLIVDDFGGVTFLSLVTFASSVLAFGWRLLLLLLVFAKLVAVSVDVADERQVVFSAPSTFIGGRKGPLARPRVVLSRSCL